MPSLIIFLDTSVILAGLASPNGGSGIILEGGARSSFKLIVTDLIIEEVLGKTQKLKIDESSLKQLVINNVINIIKTPPDEFTNQFRKLTSDPNDAHVLAGAVLTEANILVSLDKKHILTAKVKNALKPIKIFSPKQFWAWMEKSV